MSTYTVHPFGDEWLWEQPGGTHAMQFSSVDDAAAYAADYRKDFRRGAANASDDDPTVQLAASMWFTIESTNPDDDPALVGPDDRTYRNTDAVSILTNIGQDGEWPADAEAEGGE